MMVFEKIYMFGHTVGFLITLSLIGYAWRNRRHSLGLAAIYMLMPLVVWLGSVLLAWLNDSIGTLIFWDNVGYLGVFTLPVTWFVFAMVLSGHEYWLNWRRILPLMLIPMFLFSLVLSGAYFSEVSFVMEGARLVREVEFSNWLLISLGYYYLLFGIGSIQMIRTAVRGTLLTRLQVVSLIAASIIPVIANLFYLVHAFPYDIDFTSLTFVISASMLIWGFLRLHLFDPIPIARGTVLDQVSDGILVINHLGRVADMNRAVQHFLGISLSTARGHRLSKLLPQLAELPLYAEVTLQRNQVQMHLEVQTTPLYTQTHYLIGHLILLHDISARKKIEADLQSALARERELNELKTRFIADVTHGLRTPLSVILSSSEMLESYGANMPAPRQKTHFNRIRAAVNRLLDMGSDVLIFERNRQQVPQIDLQWFNPAMLCHEVSEEMSQADGYNHVVESGISEDCPLIHQDPQRLRQALENLLSNAFKYSPAGTQVRFNLSVEPHQICLEISDQGYGIPPADLPRLGQPFFRGSNTNTVPGTGMGLAIVDQAVRQMGGSLQVNSQENVGTTARLWIPRELPEAPDLKTTLNTPS